MRRVDQSIKIVICSRHKSLLVGIWAELENADIFEEFGLETGEGLRLGSRSAGTAEDISYAESFRRTIAV